MWHDNKNLRNLQNGEGRQSPWMVGAVCYVQPTQYRLYGRRFLQVKKRPNQSTEGSYKGKQKQHKEHNTHRSTK